MDHPRMQISLSGLLGVVACVAINVWLFRLGALWGIIGLNVTKHVLIAWVCQVLGVNRGAARGPNLAPAAGVPVLEGKPMPDSP